MNPPAAKGRSALFWILLAAGGSCAACSLLTLGLLGLGLLSSAADSTPPARSATGPSQGALPTGETPDQYPGSPGWLPSGRGLRIPPAEVGDEGPAGLWWHFQVLSDGKTMGAGLTLFLPDGTFATHPRPGAGELFDLEGQRAQRGSTGVGTFQVADGIITQRADGYSSRDSFSFGEDGEGRWFRIGAGKYLPLSPPTEELLVGTWKSPSAKFVFRDDGSFESGTVLYAGGYVVAAGGRGTYQLDGYLLALRPPDAPSWITTVGMTGSSFLVVGSTVYTRQ